MCTCPPLHKLSIFTTFLRCLSVYRVNENFPKAYRQIYTHYNILTTCNIMLKYNVNMCSIPLQIPANEDFFNWTASWFFLHGNPIILCGFPCSSVKSNLIFQISALDIASPGKTDYSKYRAFVYTVHCWLDKVQIKLTRNSLRSNLTN